MQRKVISFFFLILLIKTMSDVDLEIQNTTFEFILLIEDFSEICRHIFKTIYFETIFIIRGIVFSLLADLPSPVLQAARGQHSVVPGRHFITLFASLSKTTVTTMPLVLTIHH